MNTQALKTGLELTIQTPAFGYNQKQQECSNEPLIAHSIRTSLSHSLGFSTPQTFYQTGSQEQKEQPISMIGHDHASWQGVYVMEPSFPHGAAKHAILMGHDHMAHIKKRMVDDSLGDDSRPQARGEDRKCCQEPGCNEVVDGRVVYCNSHSGGRSCQQLSHLQSARKSSDLCMSPVKGSQCNEPGKDSSGNAQGETGQFIFRGADTLCKHENCSKQAQGNALYCKLHSGGTKGCMVRGCTKAAHGGTPLCIGHGGGKRCTVPGCPNAACGEGRSDCCVRHGGGKRCKFEGCGKGAQGNTDFCIRHGGGRRCKYEGCTKSAQGRTDFCIRHGGGSRCQFQGCNTSAKWGMDFCSVHRKGLLSGDNATPEALPVPSEKRRRAKKPKNAVTITAAIAGSSTQEMGILRVATMVSNRDLSYKSVMTAGQAAIATPNVVVPLSMKSPTPSGPVVSAEREAATNRAMLGL